MVRIEKNIVSIEYNISLNALVSCKKLFLSNCYKFDWSNRFLNTNPMFAQSDSTSCTSSCMTMIKQVFFFSIMCLCISAGILLDCCII